MSEEKIEVIRGYNKFGYRFRPVSLNRNDRSGLTPDGLEIGDPVPLTIAVRMPTLEQRVARYEMAGAARQFFYDEMLGEDDFQDEFDDIPSEGLSPHEDGFSYDLHGDRHKPVSEAPSKKASKPAKGQASSDEQGTPSDEGEE